MYYSIVKSDGSGRIQGMASFDTEKSAREEIADIKLTSGSYWTLIRGEVLDSRRRGEEDAALPSPK